MDSKAAEETMDERGTDQRYPRKPDKPAAARERMLDKTIADSFPASDPPSTDPDPAFDSFAG